MSLHTFEGVVMAVNPTDRREQRVQFQVETPDHGTFKVTYDGFCPLHVDDRVSGIAYVEGQTMKLAVAPLALIPQDAESIRRALKRLYWKITADAIIELHDALTEAAVTSGKRDLNTYLGEMAVNYAKTLDERFVTALEAATNLDAAKATMLLRFWFRQRLMRQLYLFGLTNAEIDLCVKQVRARHMLAGTPCGVVHGEVYEQCIKNPFVLAGVPMAKAVVITQKLRKEPTEDEMVCGEIVRTLHKHVMEKAWTCTPLWSIMKAHPTFATWQGQLLGEYDIFLDRESVYLAHPYLVETRIAAWVTRQIQTAERRRSDDDSGEMPTTMRDEIISSNVTPEQRDAITWALASSVSVITGIPGSGKTFVIREMCRLLKERKIEYMVVSFTGKAVARIVETTQEPAKAMTMDRMIVKPPLVAFRHLIIDETSMVSSELLFRFITSFSGRYKVTFIGDVDQLPTISWGSLFRHLIGCLKIPVFVLTTNHRVDRTTGDIPLMLSNAQQIVDPRRSKQLPLTLCEGQGFTRHLGDKEDLDFLLMKAYVEGIPLDEIVCICPYTDALPHINAAFQRIYLSEAESILVKETRWCVGDRVMMTVNNYVINVMNGEVGTVTALDAGTVTVDFTTPKRIAEAKSLTRTEAKSFEVTLEEIVGRLGPAPLHVFKWGPSTSRVVEGPPREEDGELMSGDLSHAFGITVHKAQGSEYPHVIVYIPPRKSAWSGFLNFNLLYTAITRARTHVHLIGTEDIIQRALAQPCPKRFEHLGARIVEANVDQPDVYTPVVQDLFVASCDGVDPLHDEDEAMYAEMYTMLGQ